MKSYKIIILVSVLVALRIQGLIAQTDRIEKSNPDKHSGLYQTVKGSVVDKVSNNPLIGATVILLESNPPKGAATDLDGKYRIEKVPVGRYNIQITYIGYEPAIISEILVTSGKEVIINIGLEQSATQINEVTIKAHSHKDKPLNSMASISARSFSVEETQRYAGGLNDPARLASSFAGVTMSSISDNGIVVRGNSAKGVSWKLEGIDIPNPNHFAGASVAGGGLVTVFSSQMLANSDFYTGAFPAEYGNALAGIFDMKFRIGNNEKREHTVQVGVLGIDISSEGPFIKGGKASYLFNYRYSTLGLMKAFMPANIGMPDYQDLSFKFNLPVKHGSYSIWGIGSIDNFPKPQINDSLLWETANERTFSNWGLKMGAMGVTHKIYFGDKTYINTTLAGTGTLNKMNEKRYDDNIVPQPNWLLEDNSSKIVLESSINHRFSDKGNFKTGFNYTTLLYNLNLNSTIKDDPSTFHNFVKEKGMGNYLEYYAQSKYDLTDNLTLFSGFNLMYLDVNKNFSFDPRISIKWDLKSGHSLSFGFGKHSQIEELKIYFINHEVNSQLVYPNKSLELSHSLHYVLGYDWRINDNMRLKVEPYYQYLYNAPGKPGTSYSMINFTQEWTFRDSLANNTSGGNYGIDFTFERFLKDGYYFLITSSIFKSKYMGDDGIWRNTRFDKGYVCNLLFGKEFNIHKNKVIGINGRLIFMGGDRESPVDMARSLQEKTIVYDDTKAFSTRFPSTKYVDLTLNYRINKRGHSSVWALQVKNILGDPMYGGYSYYYKTHEISRNRVVVVLPVLSYRVEF